MTVSIMITTRNRADDLSVTLRALRALRPGPHEVLITLDGCTDRSRAVVSSLMPEARVFENQIGGGSVPARDRMMRAASGDLVLSLDDDSYPLDGDFLPRAAAFFEQDPGLGVLCFPQRSEEFPDTLEQADFGPDELTGSYASSGAMLRRSTYLALDGYAVVFGHICEEPDYALQCTAAGVRVRRHTGLLIRHHYSGVNRDEIRIHHLQARNECWSVLLRCPSPWWPLVLLRRAAGQFFYACSRGPAWVLREPTWWRRFIEGLPSVWRCRRTVAWPAYQAWRKTLRNPRRLPS